MKKVLLSVIVISSLLLAGCGKPDAATQKVIDQINDLQKQEYITLEDLEQTKERYNSLADDQKKKVSNYDKLMEMEDNYEKLGQIPLSVDNYQEYLTLTPEYELGKRAGHDEDGQEVSKTLFLGASISGDTSKYEYHDIKVEVSIDGEYWPLSKVTNGYGLRSGTMSEFIEETISIDCDDNGQGEGIATVECAESKFGYGVFSGKSFEGGDLSFRVSKISGTVLPKKD